MKHHKPDCVEESDTVIRRCLQVAAADLPFSDAPLTGREKCQVNWILKTLLPRITLMVYIIAFLRLAQTSADTIWRSRTLPNPPSPVNNSNRLNPISTTDRILVIVQSRTSQSLLLECMHLWRRGKAHLKHEILTNTKTWETMRSSSSLSW